VGHGLYDEVFALGFELSYPSFTRGLRGHELRPHCEACAGVKGRATTEIEHPPGEEPQWDWDELPEAAWGDYAHLLVGSLPCSGKFRGVFAESEDQPHLVESMDGVLRRLRRQCPALADRSDGDARHRHRRPEGPVLDLTR
jgi:hypothetical protein